MAPQTILLTGATGYIGGSVLHQFINTTHPAIKSLKLSVLVRDDPRVEYYRGLGLQVFTFTSLDDHDAIVAAASQNDIVLHIASGTNPGFVQSYITGLAKRKQETGQPVYYIHQDGTSNFADAPVSRPNQQETREFSDSDTDIYDVLRALENKQTYVQRTAALTVVDMGLEMDVDTVVITAPNIYGIGTGRYHRVSIQIPKLIEAALKKGYAVRVGAGEGVWDFVHVEDVARLWEAVVVDAVEGTGNVPTGKTGFVFTGVGRFSWGALSEQIGKVGKELGLLTTDEVKSLTLEEAAVVVFGDVAYAEMVEHALASNSRTKAEIGKKIGWTPQKPEADFWDSLKPEMLLIAEQQKQKE